MLGRAFTRGTNSVYKMAENQSASIIRAETGKSGPLNDDRSPLLDLITCINCRKSMRLERIDPDGEGKDPVSLWTVRLRPSAAAISWEPVAHQAKRRATGRIASAVLLRPITRPSGGPWGPRSGLRPRRPTPVRTKMIGREFMNCREAAYGPYVGASDIGNSFGSHHRLLQ